MIRLTPLLRGPILIKAFDPWIQYYNAKYIVEHSLYEYFHWLDKKSWNPEGMKRASLRPGLPFTAAAIYFILNFFGIPVTIYEVCFYFPAFMGGLTVLAAYFLGKEIYDRNCGLFSAFFLAFSPGHMQRTMAGFFDNETIGVFSVLMVFLFFLKTLKTGKFSHSIMGGIFLGYLSLSWGGYQFVFYIIPIICIILILMNKYNENVLTAYAGIIGTGFLIYGLYFLFDHEGFLNDNTSLAVFLFTIVLVFFNMIHSKKNVYPKFYDFLLNSIKWVLLPAIIIFAIIIWINPNLISLGVSDRLSSVLSPLARDKMHLVASVAEHMPSAWSIFYYNSLIPLILLPLGFFFCFKRLEAPDVLLLVFTLLVFYFTGSMIRIILLFTPAAALMGSYGLVNVLKIYGSFLGEKRLSSSRKRKRQLKKTVGNSEIFSVYFLIGFLCIAQVFHATDISINQLSYSQIVTGGQYHDWEDALSWMRNNVEGTDVVVSWWDYGYWITPIGNATTVNDNNTHGGRRIGMTGMAFMQTNEIYSAKILKELGADYVLVYFGFLISGLGGDEGKWPWMLRICNDHYEYYKDEGLEEDNWAIGSVFDESDYINETSGLYKDNWFDSQLVRLMFYGEPTSPSGINPNTNYLQWYYASQIGGNPSNGISSREDDDGNEWADHIPAGGAYNFKVFKEAYFSKNHMVKIYQVDYTALESDFSIENPKVFNTGAATFDLRNVGTRDLTIKNVKVNGMNCNFTLGASNNDRILNINELETVWVDVPVIYEPIINAVNITVVAEADALGNEKYLFDKTTEPFFVKYADSSSIRINKANSKVEQKGNLADIYLEVENTGKYTVNLEEFYVNDELNSYNATSYVTGSSVLKPGTKSIAYISNVQGDFNPENEYIKGNLVGAKTTHGEKAEMLMSYNTKNYQIQIINEERILSPEKLAISSNDTYDTYIPIDFKNIPTYAYTNGTIKINIKNVGSERLSIEQVFVAKADSVRYGNIFTLTDSFIDYNIDGDEERFFNPGENRTILIGPEQLEIFLPNINLNDEIIVAVNARSLEVLDSPVASDIGIFNAIINKPNATLFENVDDKIVSYIEANETGRLLIKNTGDEPIKITEVILNNTYSFSVPNDVTFLYGDANLEVQECAYISLNIGNKYPNFKINATNQIKVNITTNATVPIVKIFNAYVDSALYNVTIINDADTFARQSDSRIQLKITNYGTQSITIDSILINGTIKPLSSFTFQSGSSFTITSGSTIIIYATHTIVTGQYYKFIARTKEGAEYTLVKQAV